MKFRNIYLQFILLFIFFLTPTFASADYTGQGGKFFIDAKYGVTDAYEINATLQSDSSNAYFYIDNNWFNSKTETEKKDIKSKLGYLGAEFGTNIYPKLTMAYGSEWTPGIDGDRKITVLFYSMKEGVKGYVRNIDEYEKTVAPFSNQREIIFLNADMINDSLLNDYLAHEFTHLIEFNQKEKRTGSPEEVWLNELRAEYAPTLLGYNDSLKEGSYLRKRVTTFLNNSSDSLTLWKGEVSDYGVISMFGHYLVDQYGVDILSDSLRISSKVGIDSINEALSRKGIQDRFSNIFTNWIMASYINDCASNKRYCYRNQNLDSLHVIPFNNFIPYTSESTLSVSQTFSNWSANWQKFSGANKSLVVNFDGKSQTGLKVFYIIRDYSGNYIVKELVLNNEKKGELPVSDLGTDKASLIIIPFVQNSNLSIHDQSHYSYNITVSTLKDTSAPVDNISVNLPFAIEKPLNQMNREELLMVLLKVIIYLASQGKLQF